MIPVVHGHRMERDLHRRCDVCIVGSGAGGSVVAARLAARGLDVIVLEEGPFHTRQDFARPDERWSYPALYQERGGRGTADRAITVLQGRAVGGGTLVNWTTCFRTPASILDHWEREHGFVLDRSALRASFEAVERRLGIREWPARNPNNDALRRGCEALGLPWVPLRRNVRGCADSGFCGLGCPVGAKQAMHRTFLADAVDAGATVYADVRVKNIVINKSRADRIEAVAMERDRDRERSVRVRIEPRFTVVSGGAINTPALLLRSGIEHPALGRRTFLHPVIAVIGRYEERIEPYYGAPQSVGSHAFIQRAGMGFFLETAPMQPMLTASAAWSHGEELHGLMRALPHLSGILALHVDGLHPADEGGWVEIDGNGRPKLHYPVRSPLIEAMRASHRAVARIHFAAGAVEVITTHREAVHLRGPGELGKLDERAYGALEHGIFTAHQMGGCAMGADPERHVVDLSCRVRGVDGLFVMDGSILPTSLGVNPSETIYGLAHLFAPRIATAS